MKSFQVRARRRRGVIASLIVAVVAALVWPGSAPATEYRVPLDGTAAVLPPDGATDHGAAPRDLEISNRVHLAVDDPEGLRDSAAAVSTPGDPAYGSFLPKAEIRKRFEPDPERVRAVRDWLESVGLTVRRPDWRSLEIAGTVSQFDEAFGVSLHHIELGSYHVLLSTTDLSIPAELADVVLGVSATGYSYQPPAPGRAAVVGADLGETRSAMTETDGIPCSTYWGEMTATELPEAHGRIVPWEPCGYTPTQLRRFHGLDDERLTGDGQVVAVIGSSSDTLAEDVNTWSAKVGTPALRPEQLERIPTFDGSPPLPPNVGMVEHLLDVEAVHGMAPGADIVSVGASSRGGTNLLDLMAYTLDHTDASIVPMSFSVDVPPKMSLAYDQVAQEGALQGVGFYVSSGDGGGDPRGNFLNTLAQNSWFTGVGGTSVAIGPDGERLWDTGWGNGASPLSADGTTWQELPGDANGGAGGGGGQVVGVPQPWYQRDVVPDSLAMGTDGQRYRVGADVAMDADPITGFLVGGKALNAITNPDQATWTYREHKYGGTSLSAPLFAGVQALAQQVSGKPIGFANPALYQRANGPALRDVVKHALPDGTPPTVAAHRPATQDGELLLFSLLGQMPYAGTDPATPDTTPGFDEVTGVGTPTGDYPWSYARPEHLRS